MADLSQKEWDRFEKPEHSHVYKQIATVMHKGISQEEVAQFYSKWADDLQYEKELPEDVYNAPIVTAAAAADGMTAEEKASVRVFDVAAGTGLCSLWLRSHGFQHIDGLDPSEGMLAKARAKNLYDRYICDFITDKRLDINDGGRIVIVTRAQHLETVEEYRDRLEPLMDRLEVEGKWQKLERKIFPGFFLDKEGILWKYQVC
ncbi:uncharacterized protein LOC127860718 isoform X2 [Dreissena polymorpha]|uniref:uncharacterized protein LOC127860718 isoform X2 n=1 Tax=Dreissena polymorpha TaxID=45954 RepID=UPI002264D033|nr:uncharacterized protein LOC127860718 isoform X2 [Dreissena polymorpha]